MGVAGIKGGGGGGDLPINIRNCEDTSTNIDILKFMINPLHVSLRLELAICFRKNESIQWLNYTAVELLNII